MHANATTRGSLSSLGDDTDDLTAAREVEVLAKLIRCDDDLVALRALRELFSLAEDAAMAAAVLPLGSTTNQSQ